jgi:hypothetical protein
MRADSNGLYGKGVKYMGLIQQNRRSFNNRFNFATMRNDGFLLASRLVYILMVPGCRRASHGECDACSYVENTACPECCGGACVGVRVYVRGCMNELFCVCLLCAM